MTNQGGSCCGPADEAATEPTKPAKTSDRAADGKFAAQTPVTEASAPSGLLQAVRRLFGGRPA